NRDVVPIGQVALDGLCSLLCEIIIEPARAEGVSITGYLQHKAASIGNLAGHLIELCHSLIGKYNASGTEEHHRCVQYRVFVKIVTNVLDIRFDSGDSSICLFSGSRGAVGSILRVSDSSRHIGKLRVKLADLCCIPARGLLQFGGAVL